MVLVHSCCADCTLKLLHSIETGFHLNPSDIALYFLNPNIHPESEYLARLKALQLAFTGRPYRIIVPNYRPKEYFRTIKQVDTSKKSVRCPHCWHLRLSQTFEFAKANGYTSVTSTLLSSSYQDQAYMMKIAQKISANLGLELLVPEDIDHCMHTAGFYKQNYCGCVYSLKDRLEEKHFNAAA